MRNAFATLDGGLGTIQLGGRLRGNFFRFDGCVGDGTGDRVEHRLYYPANGAQLAWRQSFHELMNLLFVRDHIAAIVRLPASQPLHR
jgi:hypothetical protein